MPGRFEGAPAWSGRTSAEVTMSPWERVHARYQLVADVLRRVARTGDPRTVERWRDTIEDVFGDFGAFLLHLQRHWYTGLETRLDVALEEASGATDQRRLVARAWAQMEAADPQTRAVLDEYADHPDLAANELRQRRLRGYARPEESAASVCAS
jgi:hypothetical protein